MVGLSTLLAGWPRRNARTGIVPLDAFMHRFAQDIAAQNPSVVVAVAVISLSRSDRMEATLGMPQSRAVQHALIDRVMSTLRPHDYLAVASPNEIWVVLPRLPSALMASLAASSLVGALEMPVSGTGAIVTVRPSVGIALAARSGSTALNMLKVAANAEYRARSVGHRYAVDVSNERNPLLDADIVAHLDHALAHNGLAVYYQPKIDLHCGAVKSVEALIRWSGPQHPAISPALLVDTAEQYGLMPALTRFVINTALREYASILAGSGVDKVWVNLSASMIRDPTLPALLAQMVEVWGLPPASLGLELTESTLLTDVDQSIATLKALVSQGFNLAIDDFGTGYSSLAYLRRLPLAELKIDQLFVRNMPTSLSDKQIVRTIIDLAHNFQLAVVAEGAEHASTVEMLKEMGCDQVQGYAFSKALPATELAAWIKQHNASCHGTVS
jgi:EAL domain-containing protein (putative c-di-GMP-specific phosphodiesterase class I)/GGDEF domain-containing protein